MSDLQTDLVVELREALTGMVANTCTVDGELDSMCSATNAEALRVLAKLGVVEITADAGRRVIARWAGDVA